MTMDSTMDRRIISIASIKLEIINVSCLNQLANSLYWQNISVPTPPWETTKCIYRRMYVHCVCSSNVSLFWHETDAKEASWSKKCTRRKRFIRFEKIIGQNTWNYWDTQFVEDLDFIQNINRCAFYLDRHGCLLWLESQHSIAHIGVRLPQCRINKNG